MTEPVNPPHAETCSCAFCEILARRVPAEVAATWPAAVVVVPLADASGVTACVVDGKDIPVGEVYYYVLDRDENGNEQPVCWRHVHPNEGPLT